MNGFEVWMLGDNEDDDIVEWMGNFRTEEEAEVHRKWLEDHGDQPDEPVTYVILSAEWLPGEFSGDDVRPEDPSFFGPRRISGRLVAFD